MTSSDRPSPVRDRVVVGVDGSEPSQHALRWARFLAAATGGATMEAVVGWQSAASYSLGDPGMMPIAGWDPAKDAQTIATETLAEVFGEHRPPSLQVTIREGRAAKVLLDVSVGARMLVVGSRGHGGFAGLLLGSVSAACAEHATCPVLVVHGDTPPPPA